MTNSVTWPVCIPNNGTAMRSWDRVRENLVAAMNADGNGEGEGDGK